MIGVLNEYEEYTALSTRVLWADVKIFLYKYYNKLNYNEGELKLELDIGLFTVEVQKYPSIWNVTLDEYYDCTIKWNL